MLAHCFLPAEATSSLPQYHIPCRPSGSGKTTLMDLLAGRKTVGSMEGEIRFSGTKPTRQFLRRFTGYVEQFGEHSF
jgi:ABC-type proline/glycine betaine transport system ATPase subunit